MALFPLFVKLAGRPCLVVGAGSVGESKIASLLAAGADVCVVSLSATNLVKDWAAAGRIKWLQKSFEAADLDGMFLVVAAFAAGDLTARIWSEAQQRHVLCNVVDDPEHCDFYYPAVVRRGDFQIAISTGGRSPALAQRIRQDLDRQFGPDYEQWVRQLGLEREALFAVSMDPETRKRQLHESVSHEAYERFHNAAASSLPGSQSDLMPEAQGPKPKAQGPKPGTVYLVGAGPGEAELLTLKALRLLGTADVVLHDDLVSAEVLELVSQTAHSLSVGKRHGEQHISQDGINALMILHARAGRRVVRLKGGDVSIFGRANEEVDALRAAGVACEIVPGVTAVSGAAAATKVSLTDRRTTSAVVLVTAQTCKGNARPNWRAVVDIGATVAVYMPGDRYELIANELLAAGLDPQTPCRIVSRASLPDESQVETTVSDLAAQQRLPAPAVLIIGKVAAGARLEVRGQKAEVKKRLEGEGQKAEVKSQVSEVGSQKTENRSQKSE
jgi:uroporphyrin-III C-methyltransferase/precorrin-2 dehydrogenase/sirohydrochlorin ferrochelatase